MQFFIFIVFPVLAISFIYLSLLFEEVDICRYKYNGWLYRGIKHIKCGAILGHEYKDGVCVHCGKQEHKKK